MRIPLLLWGLATCFVYACSSTSTKPSDGASGRGGGAGAGGLAGALPEDIEAGSGGAGEVMAHGGVSGRAAPELDGGAGEGGSSPATGGTGNGGTGNGGTGNGGTGNGGSGPPASEGGLGGGSECEHDGDCPNPHLPTCTARCEQGACALAPSPSLGTPFQSGPKDAAPRAGFWDASGNAYLVYPSIRTTPIGINIQLLDADGALSGVPTMYALPTAVTEVDMVAARFRDDNLGLLWHARRESDALDTTAFAVTTLAGAQTPPLLLMSRNTQDLYPDVAYALFLEPLPNNTWATITYTGTGPFWRGYVANPTITPSTPPLNDILPEGPYSVSVRSSIPATSQAAAVVNGTLFVTGFDCEWSDALACEPNLVFARYDLETLTRLGDTYTTLSTASYPITDQRQKPPALGKVGSRLAAFWNQELTTGMALGRAVFDTNGGIATMRTVEKSDLIPKAVVEAPSGGVLLIATRVMNSRYTLVAQRLDANLNFIGSAHALSATLAEDPSGVSAAPNADGRVLVTFRQSFAQHRIVHADLCQ